MTDPEPRCEKWDLPVTQCAHCRPPTEPVTTWADRPWKFNDQPVRRIQPAQRPTETAVPQTPDRMRRLTKTTDVCACGQPRGDAYACDDCLDELSRVLEAVPWFLEQLDLTLTRVQGSRLSAGGTGGTKTQPLPWEVRAGRVTTDLRTYLVGLTRVCIVCNIAHSSPDTTRPNLTEPSPAAVALWLRWRVDGLGRHPIGPAAVRAAIKIERRILATIDTAPDRIFLGLCIAEDDEQPDGECGGACYAAVGDTNGRCFACGKAYDVETSRAGLFAALDDRLCTAAEIGQLSTYLGLPQAATRERVRLLVSKWHSRGVITAKPHDGTEPRFRYGDVAPRLAATYERKNA